VLDRRRRRRTRGGLRARDAGNDGSPRPDRHAGRDARAAGDEGGNRGGQRAAFRRRRSGNPAHGRPRGKIDRRARRRRKGRSGSRTLGARIRRRSSADPGGSKRRDRRRRLRGCREDDRRRRSATRRPTRRRRAAAERREGLAPARGLRAPRRRPRRIPGGASAGVPHVRQLRRNRLRPRRRGDRQAGHVRAAGTEDRQVVRREHAAVDARRQGGVPLRGVRLADPPRGRRGPRRSRRVGVAGVAGHHRGHRHQDRHRPWASAQRYLRPRAAARVHPSGRRRKPRRAADVGSAARADLCRGIGARCDRRGLHLGSAPCHRPERQDGQGSRVRAGRSAASGSPCRRLRRVRPGRSHRRARRDGGPARGSAGRPRRDRRRLGRSRHSQVAAGGRGHSDRSTTGRRGGDGRMPVVRQSDQLLRVARDLVGAAAHRPRAARAKVTRALPRRRTRAPPFR